MRMGSSHPQTGSVRGGESWTEATTGLEAKRPGADMDSFNVVSPLKGAFFHVVFHLLRRVSFKYCAISSVEAESWCNTNQS